MAKIAGKSRRKKGKYTIESFSHHMQGYVATVESRPQ